MKLSFLVVLAILISISTGPFAMEKHHASGHHHNSIEVADETNPPSINLSITKDPMSGWNLHLQTEHFRFTPERVNQPHSAGEGHAHLFINGKKIGRLYSAWYHLADLPTGTHTVVVTLNANDHSDLVINGELIAATEKIVQP